MRMLLLPLLIVLAISSSSTVAEQFDGGEFYRPVVHFTPTSTWMNDPNGLVFYNGNYHLFYQDNPYGSTWGNMSWGHAISHDLLHWTHLPVAILFNEERMIFSGSAVPDTANTSGLCQSEECLVAIYTSYRSNFPDGHTEQDQSIAVSNDLPDALSFVDYDANPVLAKNPPVSDFRDPKVFWYAPSSKWIMVVSDPWGHHIQIYSSLDLKQWTYLSEFGPSGAVGGAWECPDMFKLAVEDDSEEQEKWVMVVNLNPGSLLGGSGVQYFVGSFNGTHFTSEQDSRWGDFGKDFYAVASYNNVTDRRIWIGWMSNWQYANQEPTSPWRTMQSIPRELSLRKLSDGTHVITQKIVREFEVYAGAVSVIHNLPHSTCTFSELAQVLRSTYPGRAFHFSMDIDLSGCDSFELQIAKSHDGSEYTGIGLVNGTHVYVDRSNSGNVNFSADFPGKFQAELEKRNQGLLHLEVLYDRTSVEVFWDNGSLVMSNRIFPTAAEQLIGVQKISPASGRCAKRAFSNVQLQRLDMEFDHKPHTSVV